MKKKTNAISTSEVRPNVFRFSHWSSVAKTYPEAVEKIFKAIKDTRPTYSWIKFDAEHLRERPGKKEALEKLTKDGVLEIEVQMGEKYKGKSVKEVGEIIPKNEVGLGIYEAACIVLAKPSLLQKWEDLGIDCPGDEYDLDEGDGFSYAPCLYFVDGGLEFDNRWFRSAGEGFGSASAFVSESILESRDLDTVVPLTLESAIKICKENGLTVTKTY